ncbi:MAG: TolC family protein [Armatimonadetes bacterium]|nr:TolC family protein [Armatimonadota bacterium]
MDSFHWRQGVVGATVLIAAAWAAMPGVASAQPLDSLIATAIRLHPTVRAAKTAIAAADHRARAASAWDPPSIGVEFRDLVVDNPTPWNNGETMLMAEQMIPLFGQNRTMANAMAAERPVAEASLETVQRKIRLRVQEEYLSTWLADRKLELNAEEQRLTELLHRSGSISFEAGKVPSSDLLRIESELARLTNQAATIATERIESLGRLNALLARPSNSPIQIAANLPLNSLPPFDSARAAIANHPELRRMEAMAQMAQLQAEAATTMGRPMLMLRGGIGYMPEGHPLREANAGEHGATATSEPMNWGLTLGAMMTIPSISWSRDRAEGETLAWQTEAEKNLEEGEGMKLEMEGMLRAAYARVSRAEATIGYLRETQTPLLERTLQALRNDYAANRTSLTTLLDGMKALTMSRMDLLMAQMEQAMGIAMVEELIMEN